MIEHLAQRTRHTRPTRLFPIPSVQAPPSVLHPSIADPETGHTPIYRVESLIQKQPGGPSVHCVRVRGDMSAAGMGSSEMTGRFARQRT
jgi:hypothetical protein